MVNLHMEDSDLTLTTPRVQKTVPMPRSLPELQQQAALHLWGGKGPQRLRFYHKGREILHASQVNRVRENDTIIVKTTKNVGVSNEGNAFAGDGLSANSTQKSDFINFGNHAEKDDRPAANRADGLRSHLADLELGKVFDGGSLYSKDYHSHPNAVRAVQNLGLQKSHFKTGTGTPLEKGTTYTDHYRQPKEDEKVKPTMNSRFSVISEATLGHTFEAQSAYHKDYYRHPGFKPDLKDRVFVNDNDSTLTDMVRIKPFKGLSTYVDHYIRFPDHKKTASCKPGASTLQDDHPFRGGSEYNDKYNEQTIKSTHNYVFLARGD